MSRGSILIVDDDEAVRVTLGAVLSDVGHHVTLAAGQADALALLGATEFDVILTDLRLEDGDGLHILDEARGRWPDTVALVLTGYASLDSAIGALRHGVYDYLRKPCPAEEVIATVARGLERRQLMRQVNQHLRDLQTAISVGRELHSALETRAEGTTALLHERDHVLATICAELQPSLSLIASLVQVHLGRLRAESAPTTDRRAVIGCLEQLQLETAALVQRVNATLRLTRSDVVQLVPSVPSAASLEISLDALPITG